MKIAIIHYSTYGHITTLAKSVQQGAEKTGAKVDLFRVPETLSEDVLKLIHAPEKPKEIPIATNDVLSEYDAFIFGIPTRFGNVPAQFSAFLDATGSLWAKGALYGKPGTFFVSTGTSGGGQESTIRFALNYLTHHGMPYIPLGYAPFGQLSNLEEVHGGSPYGAGTFSGADGSRQPSDLELEVATIQGETFAKQAAKFVKTEADSTSGGGAATGGAAAGGAVAGGAAAAATAGGAAAAGKGNNGAANVEKKVEKTGKDDAATIGKDNKAADVEKKVEKKAETTGKDATARAQQSTPAAKDEASKSGCSKCIIM